MQAKPSNPENDLILVFDGAENIGIHPAQCVPRRAANDEGEGYFYMEPARDRNYATLEGLRLHRFGLKDVRAQILSHSILPDEGIEQSDLLKFPRFMRN